MRFSPFCVMLRQKRYLKRGVGMKGSDLHIHTIFSDGMNTMEEMVRAARAKGFSAIGFSDHSFTDFDLSYCIREEQVARYLEEICRLKEEYAGEIQVYTGLEYDGYSELKNRALYDYVIGDCHYVKTRDGYHSVDHAAPIQQQAIRDYFGGDPIAYAKAYFETYVECTRRHRPDILGHFDLCSKFGFMDEDDPVYRDMAMQAMLACLEVTPIVEVNTGAIARGLRTSPYPHMFLLREIKAHGGRMTLCSDAHRAEHIGFWFDEARELLREAGFNSMAVLRNGTFEDVGL